MKPSLLFTLLLAGVATGQVYTPPPASEPAPQPTPSSSPPPPARQESNDRSPKKNPPLIDFSTETITIGGISIPISDKRLLQARFEKYLSQPPEDDEAAAAYRKTIDEILATMSPFRDGGPDLYGAFKELPAAASYPGDANICSSLAEAIYMAMLARRDVGGVEKLNQSLEQEKKNIIGEADWIAAKERPPQVSNSARSETPNPEGPAGSAGRGTKSIRYKSTLVRIAEIEALRKANIVRNEAHTMRTKAQYQVNMVQWFGQRRYEHVVMAARFYNQIWKDGDSTLQMEKNSEVSRFFSDALGVSPTVSSLDSLSNEAIREGKKYVEAFNFLLSRDELHSASQRLMEAYAIGEYLGPVATVPYEKKLRVSAYVRDLNELQDSLEAKDYIKTKELAVRLKSSARDFPSSKVDSAIAAYTLASDLAIEEAKGHLYARESDKAAEKIRTATEIWPTNPKLNDFRNLVSGSSALLQARNDFDRLLVEKNYREIARRQYELAPSLQGDPKREDAFKQIVTNLTTIEAALGKAAEFGKVGQDYAAWEQLAKLREEFPDDPKLGRELELLAPKVADFTKALDRANQLEKRTPRQTGSALAWFLKARSIYPQSELADLGVKRQLDEILQDSGQ